MILRYCSLAIWVRSLTLEIPDVPCMGKVVSLSLGNHLIFFRIRRREKLRYKIKLFRKES